jgi:hypothetical protein
MRRWKSMDAIMMHVVISTLGTLRRLSSMSRRRSLKKVLDFWMMISSSLGHCFSICRVSVSCSVCWNGLAGEEGSWGETCIMPCCCSQLLCFECTDRISSAPVARCPICNGRHTRIEGEALDGIAERHPSQPHVNGSGLLIRGTDYPQDPRSLSLTWNDADSNVLDPYLKLNWGDLQISRVIDGTPFVYKFAINGEGQLIIQKVND